MDNGLPKVVKISGLKFRMKGQTAIGRAQLDSHDAWGLTDKAKQTITVDSDLAPDRARKVFLHELLHCIAHTSSLEREWGDKEEDYVSRLSFGLHQVLADNPKVAKFLAAG